ncbi:MAG: fatty acid desaturase [Planctomycetales bacterium]|nr:fatty acid desaturase [Planctomycetales bacterium]
MSSVIDPKKKTSASAATVKKLKKARKAKDDRRRENRESLDHPFHPTEQTGHDRKAHDNSPGEATWQTKAIMGTVVLLPFLGTIAAIVLAWQYGLMGGLYLGLMIGGWVLTGMGITIGFHRMLTHRSFDTYGWVRGFWALMGSLAIEGSPLVWCAVHRMHHQFSDQDGDPHSPHLHGKGWKNWVKGFYHAHCGWMFGGAWSESIVSRYVPDLATDRTLVALDRFYLGVVALSLLAPAAIAGLVTMSWQGAALGLLWGGLVRIFVTHHITWSINSVCHVFGGREFDSGDDSRNNFLFGLLGHGEGWHNNHHAFPTSARHGLRWWQIDTSWIVIRTMQMLGLAWNVRVANERIQEAKRLPIG